MSYFPAFLKLEEKKILLVGAGDIAYEKLNHLLNFTQNIYVIAQNFSQKMLDRLNLENISFEKRAYKRGDIKDFAIVIVAVDSLELQAEIYKESKQYNCLCNAVDSTDYCDFIFPSYIKKGDLTIAISTSGASPAVAKYLRIYIQTLIPDSIVEFLKKMRELRYVLPKGKDRMSMLDKKAKNYIKDWSKL